MTVWKETALLGIYTLTPMHFGTGQTTGVVDLPIARDASTGFPIFPATGIKGTLRDHIASELEPKVIECLFGKELDPNNKEAEGLQAGLLAFSEARLIAYPVQSLNRPFLHVTCPLILERLSRDLRALGRSDFMGSVWDSGNPAKVRVLVADADLAKSTLILEDLVFRSEEIAHDKSVEQIASALKDLLPEEEGATRQRLASGLTVIPDSEFADLIQRCIPVQARIKLTGGKTTDKWKNPDTGEEESGNLWYEENLPADCLFLAFVGERRHSKTPHDQPSNSQINLKSFTNAKGALKVLQLGGNETVGHGLCFCTLHPAVRGQGGAK